MTDFTYPQIAKMIDHSLLQPTLTDEDLETRLSAGAREYDVASVCIKPYAVRRAAELLAGSTVAVGTTVGFPHGGHVTAIKVAEARTGDGRWRQRAGHGGEHRQGAERRLEIRCRRHPGRGRGGPPRRRMVKVIFENCFLNDAQKEQLCRICGEVGADFVKTSTGYGDGGATDDDLRLMRRCSPPRVQVKAAGGVRTLDRLLAVRALGVTRVGATATKAILDECKAKLQARERGGT